MSYKIIKLNTARNCFSYILKAYSIKKIWIPYYLCPIIKNTALKENCKIYFYHIDENFKPQIEFPENDFILYPDYFGICSKITEELALQYRNLIIDNAHSFYSKPKGQACFNSLRKIFPSLRDGAFLYTKKTIKIDIKQDTFTYNLPVNSYEEICKNENRLDKEPIKYISDSTIKKYNNINHIEIKNKKIKNFEYWHKILGNSNCLKFNLNSNDIPFGYPYLAKTQKTADNLVKELYLKKFQIYRYWNNMPNDYTEKIFYTNLVII